MVIIHRLKVHHNIVKVSPPNGVLHINVAVRNSERQLVQILAKTATGMRMITTYKKKEKKMFKNIYQGAIYLDDV